MNHSDTEFNDELGEAIREAFESQAIPSRPADDFLAGLVEKKQRPVRVGKHLPSRWTQVAASIPAIVASTLLVMALWRMNQPADQPIEKTTDNAKPQQIEKHDAIAQEQQPAPEPAPKPAPKLLRSYALEFADAEATIEALNKLLNDPDTRIALDIRTNRLLIHASNETQKVVKDFIETIDSDDPIADDDADAHANSLGEQYSLTDVIRFFNASIRTKRYDAESMAALFAQNREDDRAKYQRAFQAVGIPKGILSVKVGLSRGDAWIADEMNDSFTYSIDPEVLLAEFGVGCDAVFGGGVFQEILDGIHEDADGPKIDIRSRIKDLTGRVVITVHKRQQLLVGFALKNEEAISRAVDRGILIEPDGFVVNHKDVRLNSIVRKTNDPKSILACCVTNGYLLIGDDQMIRRAIDRIEK